MSTSENVLRTFLRNPIPPRITHGSGIYMYDEAGRKLLDMTAGTVSCVVLGWSHPTVLAAMREQMEKICFIDYKTWSDKNCEELAELLVSRAEHGLNKVYFAGNSGSEACEAAMKLSYQVRCDQGEPDRTWFISRRQSYHGITTDALSLGERPNLDFFGPLLPSNRMQIAPHHPLYFRKDHESLDEYARRSAAELEEAILKVGPERVCAFVGETMMGGLVGDVPPAPGYWRYIREVCDKYSVHLILDEIYCGTGASGKIYCCDWDQVKPDFILLGKTLGAGYVPISAVVTSEAVEKILREGQGRIQHGHTHQGHTLGVATALAVQRIIHDDSMLQHICDQGDFLQGYLKANLADHPFFVDVRGRGLRVSMEFSCPSQNDFAIQVAQELEREHGVLVSGKWHRFSFTPAFTITRGELELALKRFVETFKKVAADWTSA